MNENRVWTVPNLLSLLRILLTPVFIWAMVARRPKEALLIFVAASLTDALDGFTARVFKLKSRLGLWLDPVGDKILLTAAFVTLTIRGLAAPNSLPLSLTAICIGRDVLIAAAAAWIRSSRGPTVFKPRLLGKTSTVVQFSTLLAVMIANTLGRTAAPLPWLYYAAGIVACLSGFDYAFYEMRRQKEFETRTNPREGRI
jgi:cardiolipin synthase